MNLHLLHLKVVTCLVTLPVHLHQPLRLTTPSVAVEVEEIYLEVEEEEEAEILLATPSSNQQLQRHLQHPLDNLVLNLATTWLPSLVSKAVGVLCLTSSPVAHLLSSRIRWGSRCPWEANSRCQWVVECQWPREEGSKCRWVVVSPILLVAMQQHSRSSNRSLPLPPTIFSATSPATCLSFH